MSLTKPCPCQYPRFDAANLVCGRPADGQITLDAAPAAMWPDAKYRIYVTVPLCDKHHTELMKIRSGGMTYLGA